MCINFISSKHDINFAFPCSNEDLFVDIEKKLYEQYPKYCETENFFMIDGKKIARFKTIKENNIKSGFPVLLIQVENDNLNNHIFW